MCYDPSEEESKFAAIVIKIDDVEPEDLNELTEKLTKWAAKKVDAVHEVQATRDTDAKNLYELSSYDPVTRGW